MSRFESGELVLLTSQKGKRWLVRLEDVPYSSHLGGIHLGDIVGKEEGDWVVTSRGAKLMIFRPSLEDYIFGMKRHTQIIYPKDLGAIVFHGDIYPGCTVLESGMGAGALALALLRSLGGRGRLISVEKRPEVALGARENINRFFGRNPENHVIIVADIQDFALACKVDRVFVDLPEPWHAVRNFSAMLSMGGLLLNLSPNVGQVQLMHRELKANGFGDIVHFELMRRDWKVDQLRARPNDRMVAHTGFITLAKRVSQARGPDREDGENEEDSY